MTEKDYRFACDMTAIALEQRSAHLATIEKLFRSVESRLELPKGYAFMLPNDRMYYSRWHSSSRLSGCAVHSSGSELRLCGKVAQCF